MPRLTIAFQGTTNPVIILTLSRINRSEEFNWRQNFLIQLKFADVIPYDTKLKNKTTIILVRQLDI